MKRSAILERLREARAQGFPVRITRCKPIPGYLFGYVVGVSDDWLLLNLINGDDMHLNGYAAARLRDVKSVRRDTSFADRAVRVRGERPAEQPDILLYDLPGLLSSADAHFSLINIQTEKKRYDECYIGRISRLTRKRLRLEEIDPRAKWRYTRRYKLKDITCVQFGSGYEEALWLVSESERQRKAKSADGDTAS